MKRMRRIMHATDFSSASSRALAKAVELAKQNKAELLLVHVLAAIIPYDPGDGYADPYLYIELEKSTQRQAQSSLEALVKKVKRARVKVSSLRARPSRHWRRWCRKSKGRG